MEIKIERSLPNRVFNNQITLHCHSKIVFCIEHVYIKTSEKESLDNRLEWMSLDKEEFENSKEVQKI